jgi:hypothetical protein
MIATPNQPSTYTEREIRQKGARGALIDTVMRGRDTAGLKLLAEFDRLDCSYEQIAVDFAEELPKEVLEKAHETLARFKEQQVAGLSGATS